MAAGLVAAALASLFPLTALAGPTEFSISPEAFVSTLNSTDSGNGGRMSIRTGINYVGTIGLKRPFSSVFSL